MIPAIVVRRVLVAAGALAGALVAALSIVACLHPAARPDAAALREQELAWLRAVVAPGIIEHAGLEVAALEQLKLADEGGRRCLGLRVFHGQPLKNGGVRAELAIDAPYRVGDMVEYSWSFLIPEDFTDDAPRNRWWVLADWHDQPDRSRGESWDGFPARSAPIILGYGRVDGQDLIGLSYGSPDPLPVSAFPVQRGRWHALAVRVTWARDAGGRVAVRLDGEARPVAAAAGPNMHNDFQHYAKIGMYRHPAIAGDDWIYLAGVDIRNLGPAGGR
jgi:hypothetical protein